MVEEKLVQLLTEKKLKISTAESCTGGLIAAAIVNVPGASEVFEEGFVTYSNDAKSRHLGVKKQTLDQYGAVSEETVSEMAEGCAKRTGADITIVSSGIAGPGGGTEDKPVGLVYIAFYYKGKVYVFKNIFSGDREQVRRQAVAKAINNAVDIIQCK